MKSYLLNGKEAQDDHYMAPLESLSDGDYVRIEIPGERGLMVSVGSDGFFVEEERADGSTYLTTGLSKERVAAMIRGFVGDAKDWREGLKWELTTLPSKRATCRTLVLLLIGSVLVAIVWWLAKEFAQ